MNLWQQVQEFLSIHPNILQLYENAEIPIDARHWLAPWIEVNSWELDPLAFVDGLQKQFDTLPFFTSDRLTTFKLDLKKKYSANPDLLQSKFQVCLNEEVRLVQQEIQRLESEKNSIPREGCLKLDPRWVQDLRLRSSQADHLIIQFSNCEKEFTACLEEDRKIKGLLQFQNSIQPVPGLASEPMSTESENKLRIHGEEVDSKIRNIGKSIWNQNLELESSLSLLVVDLTSLQNNLLLNNICQWQLEQKRSFIGYLPTPDLFSTIQELSENIADLLWSTREQLKKCGELNVSLFSLFQDRSQPTFSRLFNEVTVLLKELAQMTFLIEHMPLPIVRTETKFYSNPWGKKLTVGSLIAHKLNPKMSAPKVRITIVCEKTLRSILSDGLSGQDRNGIGELTGNVSYMEPSNLASPNIAASFEHIRLKSLYESRKKGANTLDLVTNKKFFLLCTSELSFGDFEKLEVWTASPPIVVTSNCSQDCRAWATLLWDYGFCSIDRNTLDVPDSVSGPEIMELLSTYFFKAIGVRLNDQQCQCLADKAMRNNKPIETLEELCKEPLEGRKFSFWEWFYQCVKLTEKYFKKEWQEQHVIGFVSKEEAEGMLIKCQGVGTFLIRFSDSILGAISVAGILNDGKVYSLTPFTSKQLRSRCLTKRINDLVEFSILYPNIPKSTAFFEPSIPDSNPVGSQPTNCYYSWITSQSSVIARNQRYEVISEDAFKMIEELMRVNSSDLQTYDEIGAECFLQMDESDDYVNYQ